MKKYAVVIERGEHNLSAYVPDLPGCITTGRTVEEIERNIREAIELHVAGLREDGDPVPEPQTVVAYVECQGVDSFDSLRGLGKAVWESLGGDDLTRRPDALYDPSGPYIQ